MGSMFHTKWLWASVAITSMWVAVLFVGLFGPELVTESGGSRTELPLAAITVALFALVGTIVVAVYGFRGNDADIAPLESELETERKRTEALEGEVSQLKLEVAELRQANGKALVHELH